MTTARRIITRALQKNGVLTKSESPSSDETNDALDVLNDILALWSNEFGMIYARSWENFPITAGTGEYTIGTAATFNTSKPLFVVQAHVRQGTTDYPLDPVTDEAYNGGISDKATQGTPRFYNFDNAYPTAKIRLWPVPETSYTLYLLLEKELSTFTLNQTVDLPPGWKPALIDELAIKTAPEYGQPVTDDMRIAAKSSKYAIKTATMRTRSMDANPPALSNRLNIYSGWFH
ncbi:MAG: hypothetical protein EOM21_19390 [Gammaproteobacteria bacterium]|nr:hypothetical protein [Gammaproteobacteria bacterium]